MEHVDPDLLALIALGEPVDAAALAHAESCAGCAAELAGLRQVVGVARSVTEQDTLMTPSPAVWQRIRAGIHSPALAGETAGDGRSAGPGTAEPAAPLVRPSAPPRRGRSGWVTVAAGVVGLTVGALVVGLTARDASNPTPPSAAPSTAPSPLVAARADLEALPERSVSGVGSVVNAGGERILQVRVTGELPDDGYREVWLLTPDAAGLVSLGVLAGTDADVAIPDGLDLADYPVVDISQEQFDGDPTHSGDSLSRGTLG